MALEQNDFIKKRAWMSLEGKEMETGTSRNDKIWLGIT